MKKYATALLLFFLASVCTAQTPKPATKALQVEDFMRYDEFAGMKLSPTGEYLAYLGGKYGRGTLAVLSFKDKKIIGGLSSPEGFDVYDFNWVSATRLIYRISERRNGLIEPSPTGEIFAVNVDGHGQSFIYGYRAGEESTGTHLSVRQASYASAELVSALRNDDRHILIAEYPWRETAAHWEFNPDARPTLYRLDVLDGKKSRVDGVPLAGAEIIVDHNDEPRFAIGRNDKMQVVAAWKPEPGSEWALFSLPGFRDESIAPIIFGEDNQSIFFTATHTGEKYSALFKLDLKTHELTQVFALPDSGIEDVMLDFTRQRIVAVEGSDGARHWLDPQERTAKVYAALERAFPNAHVAIVSLSQDGRQSILRVSTSANPGDYYLFDTTTVKADYLRPSRRWIDPNLMRPKSPFVFKARDGLELHGYLTLPVGQAPFPLVVLPHGGPHLRDYNDFDSEVQLLANRGFAVLQVNFRGSDGYGLDFMEAGYGEWGGKMQDDVTDATRWAIDNKVAAEDRICIYGASYGGYAALMGAIREPKLYRCAIGYAGVYDLELMLSSADIPRSKSGRAYLEKTLGTDHAQMRARSPAYNAERIEVPVLLIHGKEDWRADFDQAKKMKAALEKSNKKFEWMALSGEGHGAYDEKTRVQIYQKILAFLDQNLMQAH